eukprot:14171953-Ditylum_brightwellii.AAC.1
MERTEILANIRSACSVTNNPSTVQPSMIPSRPPCIPPVYIQALPILHTGQNSQVLCSAVVLLCIVYSSSSDEDYHQSDDGDHYSDLEE